MSDSTVDDGQATATMERAVPRLKTRYHDEIKAALQQQLGLAQRDAGADAREDRHQHGRRPGHPAAVAARGRRHRPHRDLRAEADRDQGQALDRRLQAPRGPVDRHQGHAARRPHVGVPRPPDRRSPSPASATSAGCRPTSWDGRGNYTFGLNDQTVFPEIDYDKIDTPRGMDITIVTTATDDAGRQGPARRVRVPVPAGRRPQRPRPQAAPPQAWPGPRQEEVSRRWPRSH